MITASKFANLFPMLRQEELKELAQDIKEHGLRRKIVLHNGEILDGRNRHAACQIAGVEPEFEEYEGDDPLEYVLSENLHRRHLTDSQRGIIAAEIATMKRGARTDLSPIEPKSLGRSIEDAARAMNIGASTVKRAKAVLKSGTAELVDAVRKNDLSLGAASVITAFPKEEQTKLVKAGPAAVIKKAAEMRGKPKAGPVAEFTPEDVETKEAANPKEEVKRGGPAQYKPDDARAIWTVARMHLDRIHKTDRSLRQVMCQTISYCVKRAAGIIKPPGKERGNMLPQYQPDQADEIWQMARATLRRILPSDKSRERVLLEMIDYCIGRLEAGE